MATAFGVELVDSVNLKIDGTKKCGKRWTERGIVRVGSESP